MKREPLWLSGYGYRKLCHLLDERDKHRCIICGSMWNLHHHHVQFRSDVHCDREDNMVVLCAKCHGIYAHGKKAKAYRGEFEEYLQSPEIRAWRRGNEGRLNVVYQMTRKGK